MQLPAKIVAKVERRFLRRDQPDVLALLLAFYSDRNNTVREHERVIECIIGLAGHDANTVRELIEHARSDYRDLIGWYEHAEQSRKRFFEQP